jgi:lipoprotein-anchoring transpeptidase ErfK/SrfK
MAAGCGGAAARATAPPVRATTARPGPAGAEIARARGGRLPVYAAPGGARRTTLASPNAYGAPRVLLVTRRSGGWLEALLPMRPNGSRGWVRASDVTLTTTTRHVTVRLGALRFTVYDGARVIRTGQIAVGTRDTPTPPGHYYFTELLRAPDPHGDYGPYAYGLSGHSPKLHRFAGGPGQLALHGTNHPGLVGHRVSHGCIRLRNPDITWMARNLVLGTPVTVQT